MVLPSGILAAEAQLKGAIGKVRSGIAEKASAALSTMKKILENITNNPDEEKYRRMSNAAIQQTILGVPGAIECLQIAGFAENDGHLVVAADGLCTLL